MRTNRLYVVVPALVLLVLVAAGGYVWGRHSGSPSVTGVASQGSATTHDQADVRFAAMMVPHHEQAVSMSAMVASRDASAQVRALAARIDAAQGPEIDEMKGWLADWGGKPATGRMSGMMSDGDMSSLGKASGAAFDKAWVTMMIAHHTGALTMARQELADGKSSQALGLATSIVVTQSAEIAEMKAMLR